MGHWGLRVVRRGGAVVLLAAVAASCSVSTPRDGWTESVDAGSGDRQSGVGSAPPAAAGDDAATGGTTGAETDAGTDSGNGPAAGSGSGSGGRVSGRSTATTVAAAGRPAVGVTDKSITISVIAPYTGPYGAIIEQLYENGFQVWLDDVNSRGGINGRQVIAKKVDNRNTVEGGVAACKDVQSNGSYLAATIVGQAGSDVAAVECLDKAGIATITIGLSSYSPQWKYAYSPVDPYKWGFPLASFIRGVIGDKANKIGIIYLRDDPVMLTTRVGMIAGMKELGIEPAREEAVAAAQGSFVAEMSRMRSSGATSVAIITGNEVVGILRDAKAIGYSPHWTGAWWVTDEFSAAGGQLMTGIKAPRPYSTVNAPAYKAYVDKANAQGRRGVINSTTMSLYSFGDVVGNALRNAGSPPTATSIGPGIESIVNFDNGIYHLSFGKGVHIAESGLWPMVCCNSDGTWHGTGPPQSKF